MAVTTRFSATILLAVACLVSAPGVLATEFKVRLQNGSDPEKASEQQLRRLAAKYDLAKWVQTDAIVFDQDTIPHSHPVLTLHARHLNDDGLFVSTFIHEQMHWWLTRHPRATQAALKQLKERYPTLPVGFPDGAEDLEGSYEHLLVIFLELDGVRRVLGEAEEKRIQAFWANDHYKTLYRIVAKDWFQIGAVVKRNGLML